MHRIPVCLVLSLLLFSAFANYADEPRREAVHRRAEEGLLGKEPEWKKALTKALEQKVSFEFAQTPLTEAIAYLQEISGVNMVVAPGALEEAGDVPITLKVSDMPLRQALSWIVRLTGLVYESRDDAILITDKYSRAGIAFAVYDLADLLEEVPDREAFSVGLDGRIASVERQAWRPYERLNSTDAAEIAERIMANVEPSSWSRDLGTLIEEVDGKLVVTHRPEVHEQIARVLENFTRWHRVQIRVEARFLAVSEGVLDQLKAYRKPGAKTIYVWQAQLDYLDRMLEDGREAQQVASLHVACRNGQRCHTLSGTTFEREDQDGKKATFFRGTILDVRPKLGPARKYVTMDLRLTRVTGGDKPGEQGQTFRYCGSVTCLETDTVLLAGATSPEHGGKRLVALVTPHVLRLEPQAEEKPEAGVATAEDRP